MHSDSSNSSRGASSIAWGPTPTLRSRLPPLADAFAPSCSRISGTERHRTRLLKSHTVERIPGGHVRQHHLIADAEARDHFDVVDRASAQPDLHARVLAAAVLQLEEADGGLLLPESGAARPRAC